MISFEIDINNQCISQCIYECTNQCIKKDVNQYIIQHINQLIHSPALNRMLPFHGNPLKIGIKTGHSRQVNPVCAH